MVKPPFVVLVLLAIAAVAQPPAAPGPDAAPTVNPVKPTAESQAKAKKMYGYDCAMCHGEKGDGKGDLVADMKLTMKDLTDPATLAGMSDGEIFNIIKNGKGQMTGEGDRAKPDDIWNLVIYVRSLTGKQRAAESDRDRPVVALADVDAAPAVVEAPRRAVLDLAGEAIPEVHGIGAGTKAGEEAVVDRARRNLRDFGEGVPDPFRREWHLAGGYGDQSRVR